MANDSNNVREVRYAHSPEFLEVLQQLGVSLLVSTYQAGKLCSIGQRDGKLALTFHNFEQAMGVAVAPDRIAVGARSHVWILKSVPDIARRLQTTSGHDSCYLARSCFVTDDIHGHEMAFSGDELWMVNTRFSCLCTLDNEYSFTPRWRPPFISQLAAEDRCHLNGLALAGGQPELVTVMAESDTAGGWRETKATSGTLIDVTSGESIASGFAMPHSPRIHADRYWVLDSGRGELVTLDTNGGGRTTVTRQPGYTRGLDFAGPIAFIGLSRIRESSTFGGIPIAEKRDLLKCGVAIVDLRGGKHLAHFEFTSGVEEIFDVRVLPQSRVPYLTGPYAAAEQETSVWYVPSESDVSQTMDGIKATNETSNTNALSSFQKGNLASARGRFDDAEEHFTSAVDADPTFASAHCNLGVALQFQGKLDASIAALEKSLKVEPELAAAHMNLAMTLFLDGQWQRAWQEYEWRWKCDRFNKHDVPVPGIAPQWTGEPLEELSLCVYGEQGIGDEIMFASLIPFLVERCKQLILCCQPRLVSLFRRSFPNCIVIAASNENFERIQSSYHPDFQVAIGSLPLQQEIKSPTSGGFLVSNPMEVENWRAKLANDDRRLVGISWRGGKDKDEIQRRSAELESWSEVFKVGGVQLINVQYACPPDELATLEKLSKGRVISIPEVDPLLDMDGFAAMLSALDLVISVDNSTVHLAGGVGTPTWALVSFPSASYWRWGMTGSQTIWYNSVRLRRKNLSGSWRSFLTDTAGELEEFCQ